MLLMDGCHSQEYMFLPEIKCCMNSLMHISIGYKCILGQKLCSISFIPGLFIK